MVDDSFISLLNGIKQKINEYIIIHILTNKA